MPQIHERGFIGMPYIFVAFLWHISKAVIFGVAKGKIYGENKGHERPFAFKNTQVRQK